MLERGGNSNDGHELQLKDLIQWWAIIRWHEASPFTGLGDSDSPVFAKVENVTIPLGIRVGWPTSVPNHRRFIRLETFSKERERTALSDRRGLFESERPPRDPFFRN